MSKDRKTAFVLFERLRRDGGPIFLTRDTADDLSELGIKLPDQSEIMPVIPPDALVLCVSATTPLIMPDNRLGRCTACGKAVQLPEREAELRAAMRAHKAERKSKRVRALDDIDNDRR